MKPWLKITLAVVAGAAIWGGLVLDQHLAEKEEVSKKQEAKVLDFESKDVLKITLQNKHGQFVFQRDTATSDWRLVQPQGPKLDQDSIRNMLAAIQSQNYEQHLEEQQKAIDSFKKGDAASAQVFGFEKPRASVVLDVAANKEAGTKARELKFWLGGDLAFGAGAGAAFNAVSSYAVSSDRKGLIVVPHSLLTSLEKDLKDLRTKTIGDFLTADVASFELTKSDGTQLVLSKSKDNGQSIWSVSKPKQIKADNNQVGLYLDSFTRLRADNITESAAINEQNKTALGLAAPSATLVLKAEDGKVLQTIQMGLTKESLYLTLADGAVGSVELTKFSDLAPSLKFFRDRRVFAGVSFNDINLLVTKAGQRYQKEGSAWYNASADAPKDPKKPEKVAVDDARNFVEDWEFSTAEDILDADETTELAKFGLDKPLTQFTLGSTDDKKPQIQVTVGNRVPNNEKAVYLKRADKPEVFVMETKWLDVLTRLDQGGQSPQAKK
ncbi:MAG: DUF4340 domain-containing protein [Betaproteobacteria bacterium]|nr:DUF4340 domain-containing protein [Betaproteobacteria bacterium]